MRIAVINMIHTGSTGDIMFSIAHKARSNGHTVWTYSANIFSHPRRELPAPTPGHSYFGSFYENAIHYILGTLFGYNGCFSYFSTKALIRQLKKNRVELVHLHNLHQYCFNLPVFFKYAKKHDVRVIWTLHDCWAFTGHCPHFDMIGCDKWKTGCHNCPIHNQYPASKLDDCKRMFRLKKKWFSGIKNMTLVTPSVWLADRVKESFLSDYPVQVINNGIDLTVFKPTESDFREKYSCQDKFIILGVASYWSEKKGLDVFIELAKRLDDSYKIVLVGTDEKLDANLPDNVISIHRTRDKTELAQIYTAADVFVNPTREDTFPTVNIEALACTTPVVTFDTGGSPEIINDSCGLVVEKNSICEMEKAIRRLKQEGSFDGRACVSRTMMFDKDEKYDQYVRLYENRMTDM